MSTGKALQLMSEFESLGGEAGSGNESGNENISELQGSIPSSDEEVIESVPANFNKTWYESETAIRYNRLSAMGKASSTSDCGILSPEHLLTAIRNNKKKAVQHLIKQKVELAITQKDSLVENLGRYDECTFDYIKMLGDVYVENNMLHEATKMYKMAIAGYESFDKLQGPLDYLKDQHALSRLYVKVGRRKQNENKPREAEDFYAKAIELLELVWTKCNENILRRQKRKVNKFAQLKKAGDVGPGSTRGTMSRLSQRGKGVRESNIPSTHNKAGIQGGQDRPKDCNFEDKTDDWYRLGLDTIADLALLYTDEYRFGQASETYRKALKKFRAPLNQVEIFNEGFKSQVNLPHEEKQRRDETAARVYETALKRFDNLYKQTHVLNMIIAVNLGINYFIHKKFLEAEEQLSRAVKGFEELVDSVDGPTAGQQHMMTLLSIHQLGVLLTLRYSFNEAVTLPEKAKNGFSTKLGLEHPLTLAVLSDLAQNYLSQRPPQYNEAERLFRKSKIGFEGQNHRLSLRTTLGLCKVLAQKDIPTTLQLCSDILQSLAPQPDVRDIDVCHTLFSLGQFYAEQDNLSHAESLLQECSKGYLFLGGPTNIKYLRVMELLGRHYALQNKTGASEKALTEANKGFEIMQGKFHTSTLTIARELGSLHLIQKRFEDAEVLCDRAYRGFQKVNGQDSRQTAEASQALGAMYFEQGKFNNAKDMYDIAFRSFQILFKHKREPSILKVAMDAAKVHAAASSMEDSETAEKLYKYVVDGLS